MCNRPAVHVNCIRSVFTVQVKDEHERLLRSQCGSCNEDGLSSAVSILTHISSLPEAHRGWMRWRIIAGYSIWDTHCILNYIHRVPQDCVKFINYSGLKKNLLTASGTDSRAHLSATVVYFKTDVKRSDCRENFIIIVLVAVDFQPLTNWKNIIHSCCFYLYKLTRERRASG